MILEIPIQRKQLRRFMEGGENFPQNIGDCSSFIAGYKLL